MVDPAAGAADVPNDVELLVLVVVLAAAVVGVAAGGLVSQFLIIPITEPARSCL